MPLAHTFPSDAEEIRQRIRDKVRRPRPSEFFFAGAHQSIRSRKDGCCPMGMLPEANQCTPASREHFKGIWDERPGFAAIRAFWWWWDCQKDIKAAIAAVWGKAKR